MYKAKVKFFTKKTTKLVDYFSDNTQVTGTQGVCLLFSVSGGWRHSPFFSITLRTVVQH